MKRKMFFVLGLVLSITVIVQAWANLSVQAQLPAASSRGAEVINGPKPPILPQPEISNQVSPQSHIPPNETVLCFTCGGSWPLSVGQIDLTSGSTPLERGSGCSGSIRRIVDGGPRLCNSL